LKAAQPEYPAGWLLPLEALPEVFARLLVVA
jgi:hypothetical protein